MPKQKIAKTHSKYFFYENSVQSPKEHVDFLDGFYKKVTGRKPSTLREDFCGTFALAAEWVRRGKDRKAIAIDLDPEPLYYGLTHRVRQMKPEVRSRLTLVQKDVRTVTPEVDMAIACNFSFNIFKKESELVQYFKQVRKSLHDQGVFVIEIAGGPGFTEKTKEERNIRIPGISWKYSWEQKSFNPITYHGLYAIHFKFKDGSQLKNAFTYDWRVWTIPEIRYLLSQAGFEKSVVFWEVESEKYQVTETGDNDHSWIAHIVGIKKSS